MKILVTGCEGMLGRSVMARLAPGHELVGVDLADGDLTAPGIAADLVNGCRPEWVLHCAAWTDVDGAEAAREQAMSANAGATEALAAAAEGAGAGLTLISTDYVFNGRAQVGYTENMTRDPVNYYGLTKARAEERVERLTTPWQIVRTSWLFGDGKVNFIKTIRRLLGERETLQVVDDQRGCPTYTVDLAGVLGFLITGRQRGVFHATNAGATTWYELARAVAGCLGADPERILPCGSEQYPTPATRPAMSILLSENLESVGCPERPAWTDAVQRYVAELERGTVLFP